MPHLDRTLRQTKRLIVTIVGVTVLCIGIVMIVLPGPAIIVIPVALGILATEFAWARRVLNIVRERIRNPQITTKATTTKPKGDKMSFNDLYKQRRDGHHDDRGYYGGHRDGHHGGLERYLNLFEKLKNNKKLWIGLSIAAIVIIIVIIAVIIMLIPPIIKMFETIQKGGIKGLLETAKPLLDLLWSGKGK